MRRLKQRSWIVQQLLVPMYDKAGEPFVNPFGNSLLDIPNETEDGDYHGARDNIAQVFNPAYMGAAEFEWGALPKSLGRMFDNDNVIMHTGHFTVGINIHLVGDKDLMKDYRKLLREVFWSYPKAQADRYKDITKNDYGSLYKTLAKIDGYDEKLKGWYDLENDYAAFVDDDEGESMAKKFLDAVS